MLNPTEFIDDAINKIKEQIGNEKAIIALSGGVDSSVCSVLVEKAIGDISHIKRIAYYKGHFPRITFDEAENALKKNDSKNIAKYIEYNDGWRNITRLGEKEILKIYGGIVWITNYDELAVQ